MNFVSPLGGGFLIGLSVSLMLVLNGRVTGVSGILARFLQPGADSKPAATDERSWRGFFLAGLIAGGLLLKLFLPASLEDPATRSWGWLLLAGWLVGFGSVVGSGCTSGHGICGIARGSKRSIVATVIFMAFGILSATLFRVFVLEAP